MAGKLKSRTSWREKLERELPTHGKVVAVPPKMQKRFGKGTMLIPRPLDIDAVIRRIPRGRFVTVNQIREKLAKASGADSACPMTTGIFIRIGVLLSCYRERKEFSYSLLAPICALGGGQHCLLFEGKENEEES